MQDKGRNEPGFFDSLGARPPKRVITVFACFVAAGVASWLLGGEGLRSRSRARALHPGGVGAALGDRLDHRADPSAFLYFGCMSARSLLLVLIAAAAWLLLPIAAGGQGGLGPPAATLRMETTSIAAGIGASWGKGTLRFQDREHAFTVSGLSVADLGVSKVTASGNVWGLQKLEDFSGTYSGVDVGVAVGGGTAGIAMRNENGVYIKIRAAQRGVKLSLATQGTTLQLVKE